MQRLKIRTRKLLVGLAVGASVGGVVAIGSAARFDATEKLELATYDLRARWSVAPERASKDIVIIDVDEESFATVAKEMSLSWPWPRELFGVAATYLHQAGARAIVFDFIFEDDPFGADDTLNFAAALAETKSVIGGSLSFSAEEPLPTPGKFAAKLATVSREADADRLATLALTWRSRAFVLPAAEKGRFEVWVGGTLDEGGATTDLGRMLQHDTFREHALKSGAETLPAADAEPVVRELRTDPTAGPYRLEGERTAADLLVRLNALDMAPGELPLSKRPGVRPPIPLFVLSAGMIGNVSQHVDADGKIRHFGIVAETGGKVLPSLGLAGAMTATGDRAIGPSPTGRGLLYGGHHIPLEPDGTTLLRFYGSHDVYRHFSIWDLMQSFQQIQSGETPKIPPATFKGAIAVFSASARALKDVKPSPVDPKMLGAEIVANAIDNILQGDFIRRAPPWANAAASFGLCLLLGVVALYIWFVVRSALLASLLSLGVVAAVVGSYAWLSVELYRGTGLWLDLALPALGGAASWAVALLANTYVEGKDRRFVQEALGRYTSKALVQELMRNPELLSLGSGQRRTLSVFFSDIQGFTTISEGLQPERLVALLNDYLTHLTDIILESGGIVDKYIGDAIMAFWGAPMPMENHAEVACLTALHMRDKIEELREGWFKEFGYQVVARAGINTGPVVVGNTGSSHKFNYTVLGDTVNLASRLEGANKPYGTVLMISEATAVGAKDKIEVRELDFLAVKGKDKPVVVFELLCEKGKLPPERDAAYRKFEEGLRLYRAAKFEAAIEKFHDVQATIPDDGPCKTYLERCATMAKDPPPADWDGVYHMKEK